MEDLKIYAAIIGSFILVIAMILAILHSIYSWIKNQVKEARRRRYWPSPVETPEDRKRKEKKREAIKRAKEDLWISQREKRSLSTLSGYPKNWNEISQNVKRRDGHRCGNCGSTTNLHAHHIVPIRKGGTSNLSNLRTLCNNCHKKLHPHMQ